MIDLAVHVEWSGRHALLTVHGDLPPGAGAALEHLLVEICSQAPRRLFVDLATVSTLESSVIGVLAAATGKLRQTGCPVLFINPSPPVRQHIYQHGLDDMLELDTA